MDLNAARLLARTLMRQHGVGDWNFEFDRAVKRYGLTNFRTRTISLSKTLTELNPEKAVRQTILHEIAHAKAGMKAGHGPEWLRVARSIGFTGGRTKTDGVIPTLRYQGKCAKGHTVQYQRAPKPGIPYSCSKCSKGFSRDHLLTWTDTQTGKVLAAV